MTEPDQALESLLEIQKDFSAFVAVRAVHRRAS